MNEVWPRLKKYFLQLGLLPVSELDKASCSVAKFPLAPSYFQNYKLLSAVLCAALYPNIVQVLSPELKYKQTSTGAMSKAPTAQELKVLNFVLIGLSGALFSEPFPGLYFWTLLTFTYFQGS